MAKASTSQDMLVFYQRPLQPSAFSVHLSECDAGCVPVSYESKLVYQYSSNVLHLRELVKTESVCGVSGFRSGAICGVGVGCGPCLASAAGRNRMSQSVSVAPQISGSRCSFPGHKGLTGLWHPCWHCLGTPSAEKTQQQVIDRED